MYLCRGHVCFENRLPPLFPFHSCPFLAYSLFPPFIRPPRSSPPLAPQEDFRISPLTSECLMSCPLTSLLASIMFSLTVSKVSTLWLPYRGLRLSILFFLCEPQRACPYAPHFLEDSKRAPTIASRNSPYNTTCFMKRVILVPNSGHSLLLFYPVLFSQCSRAITPFTQLDIFSSERSPTQEEEGEGAG